MNDFGDRLGAIAHGVSRDYELSASDDSAAMIRRARRGRAVWTGTVGTATLASAAALAIGGSAVADGLFETTVAPATHSPSEVGSPTPTPTPTESESDDVTSTPTPTPTSTGDDDFSTEDPGDDHGGNSGPGGGGDDDPATHDVGDDKGGLDGSSDDVADDSSGSGHGGDDSADDSSGSGHGGDDGADDSEDRSGSNSGKG